MFYRIFIFIFWIIPCFANEQAIVDNFSPLQVEEAMSKIGLCETPTAEKLCRMLPWAPAMHEGVLDLGYRVYVFLRIDQRPSRIQLLINRTEIEKRDDYAGFLAIANSNLGKTKMLGSMAGIYIVWVQVTSGEMKPKSFIYLTRDDYNAFVGEKAQRMIDQIDLSAGDWRPELGLLPNYQSYLFN